MSALVVDVGLKQKDPNDLISLPGKDPNDPGSNKALF